MKLIIEDFDIHYENISFAKIKKNVIMEGTFTKIVYSDAFITINGLYLTVPLILSSLYSDKFLLFNFSPLRSEKIIFDSGNASAKNVNLPSRATANYFSSPLCSDEKMNYIETESKSNYLYFYSYTPHNLLIIKKIANI